MNLAKIQQEIRNQKLDGWLFFDHHMRDPLAYRVLGLPPGKVSRRWYYMIPAEGEPKGMEHRIERNQLASLPGEKIAYSSWTEQLAALGKLTAGMKRVAMQYSPMCAVPYVATVDAGTVELVRSLGVEVVTSAELIQIFEARWTPEQYESHMEAGRRVDKVRSAAFELIRERTRNGAALQEVEVKDFVRKGFADAGLLTDSGPIVGCNANASNPHYEPSAEITNPIKTGDWVLLDMWAKLDTPGAVYYDITWTAFCGDNPTDEMRRVFTTVRDARDAAINRVTGAISKSDALRGFEVDDACRAVIVKAGYAEYFTHRTGHSIGVEVHGNGANMDNFETHDERRVMPWSCFSVEPGIYLPNFGVRSEINMFIGEHEAQVTGAIQREMVLLLMPPQALAAIATLLGFAVHGNRVELRLDRGSAELVWLTPSTFHFRRVLDGPLRPVEESAREPFAVQTEDAAGEIHVRSRLLEVTIAKQGLLVRVRRINGATLMVDLTTPRSEAGGVVWERQMQADADYFGLGPRTDPTFSLRGKSLAADVPLLVSTAGYGEYHPGGGVYHFDFTRDDRYRISGPEIDYYFYYGPTPKEILEEHNLQPNRADPWTVNSDRFGSWGSLKASLLRIVEGGMAAANAPMLNLGPYKTAPTELQTRARQLGSLVARVSPGTVGLSGFRKQLDTFYGSYIAELQDRGFPIWHPLPFQVPDDREGVRHPDEFLLGDEMLIAPIYEPGDKRSVYLPRGIWTNLETNQATQGPKTIMVETKSLPVFARNGALIPLDAPNGMALHYFPKLGGEFFLLEGDIADYSQVHAAPALDVIRLEIESKKDRDYQWVVHHAEKPASVEFDTKQYREVARLETLAPDSWFYDAAQKNLHVRVKVKAGEDCIINLNY